MQAPTYPFKPIHTIQALALALGESERLLEKLSVRADRMYRHVPQEKKGKPGETRDTYDAHEPLKRIQRKLVDRILSRAIFPDYLHGGIRDINSPRSIHSNAAAHAGARFIILQDIRNFYPSISKPHVEALFSGLFGFGSSISALMASICTREGSTPQGASTSGYIANLLFWDVEPKIVQGLLDRGFRYSRFADDITISCGREPSSDELSGIISSVTGMLASKGCHQKRAKLHMRVRGQGIESKSRTFQPLTVTGLSVVNKTPGLTKLERRRIRSSVRELEIVSESTSDWMSLQSQYHRAMGRVGRLLACGHPDGEALKARLNAVKRAYQTPVLERYLQSVALDAPADGPIVDDSHYLNRAAEQNSTPPWEE